MMKHIYSFIAILAAAAGFVSCSKEEANNPDNPDDFVSVIHACTDEVASKTALGDGYSVVWSEGDQIKLSGAKGDFIYTLKDEDAGKTSGTFEHVGAVPAGTYEAYYPTTFNGTNWPETQNYVKNGGRRENLISNAPMKAFEVTVSADGSISDVKFYNPGGLFQIIATGKETVKSIKFEASGFSGVTLDCGEGVALDQNNPTNFNIALPARTYDSAVITFTTIYGAKVVKHADRFIVKEGKIYPTGLGTLDFPAALLVSSEKARVTEPRKATLYGKVIYTGKESEYASVEYGFAYTNNAEYTTAEAIYANGTKEATGTLIATPMYYSSTLAGLENGSTYRWIAYAKKGDEVKYGEVKDFKTTELQMSINVGSWKTSNISVSLREGKITFNAEPSVKTGYKAYILIAEGDKTKEELEKVTPVEINVSGIHGEGASSYFDVSGLFVGLNPNTNYSVMAAALMPDGYTYAESDVTKIKTDYVHPISCGIMTSNPSTYMDVKIRMATTPRLPEEEDYFRTPEHKPVFKLALTGKSGYHDAKSLMELPGIKKSGEMIANNDLEATYKFEGLDYGLMNHLTASVTIDGHTYYYDVIDQQLSIPDKCIDLGPEATVYWRDRNLGASEVASQSAGASARGDIYMWGETYYRHYGNWNDSWFKDDKGFDWDGNYKWQLGSGVNVKKYIMKNHDGDGAIDNKSTLDMEDDAARVNLGYPWRMPRESECKELEKKEAFTCVKYPDDDDDKVYYEVKSKNGNSVKFQTTGKFHYKDLEERNTVGIWTADLYTDNDWNSQALCLRLHSGDFETEVGIWRRDRVDGYCIRPVCSKITSANY